MLARCARCQGTFTTDRYGRQTCPHCGSELILPDPSAPPGAQPQPPAPAPQPTPQAPPPAHGAGQELPPGPPPGGYVPPGGWYPPPPPPGGGWGSYPPPPGGPSGPDIPSPFADRARRGFFGGFLETWKLAATQPQRFFSRVRIDQTGSALLFAMIAFTIGSAAEALYTVLSRGQMLVVVERLSRYMSPEQAAAAREALLTASPGRALAQVVFAPLIALVAIYVLSGIFHLLLLLFRGASRGFDGTVTVVAHAAGMSILLAVPVCGTPIALVWAAIVCIAGLGAAQRCGPGKAAAAVLSPLLLACVCCCGALGLTVPALLKGAQDAAGHGQRIDL